MASRLELHEELCIVLGSRNVYFSPPESLKLNYPCIVYRLSDVDTRNANNQTYKRIRRYELTVIDRDPDSTIFESVLDHFEMCSFDRNFKSDNLDHNTLNLYY